MMKKRFQKILVAMMLLCGIVYAQEQTQPPAPDQGAAGGAYSPEAREYHLKAAFLRYVVSFVEWPGNTLPADKIGICILGLLPNVEGIYSIDGKIVQSRPLVISKVLQVNDAKTKCQMLFISKAEESNIPNIVQTVSGLPVLTFGDMEGFAEKGGQMNFYVANNRLGIMINPASVEKSKFVINPRMLKVVTVIPKVS